MDQLKHPKTFVFGNGNVAETWKAWQKSVELFWLQQSLMKRMTK